jgi:hypothetical protein
MNARRIHGNSPQVVDPGILMFDIPASRRENMQLQESI